MRVVNRGARGPVEHAALVVDAEPAPQREAIAEIHRRPERSLAGRKIRAGGGRVIRAGPAAERDLYDQHGDPRDRQSPDRPLRRLQLSPRRRQREPPEQRKRREPAEQVQRHDERLQEQRHRPHAEHRLHDEQRDDEPGQDARLRRVAAVRDRKHREPDHEQAEPADDVAVHHLVDRLLVVEGPVRMRGVDFRRALDDLRRMDVAVAAGPVGQPRPAFVSRTQAPTTTTIAQSTVAASAARRNQTRPRVSGIVRDRPPRPPFATLPLSLYLSSSLPRPVLGLRIHLPINPLPSPSPRLAVIEIPHRIRRDVEDREGACDLASMQ